MLTSFVINDLRNFNEFSGKMSLMIILEARKNQGFTLSLEDIFFEKPQGREREGVKLALFNNLAQVRIAITKAILDI